MNTITTSKYGLYGKLRSKEGKREELLSFLLKAAESMAAIQGCHMYIVGKDTKDPEGIWVTEVWDSKEDHDNSLKLSGTIELIKQAMPIIDMTGGPEQIVVEVMGGLGL